MQLRGNHASNVATLYSGDLGYGANDETSQLATCSIYGGSFTSGRNCSIVNFTKEGGTAIVRKKPSGTIVNRAGDFFLTND